MERVQVIGQERVEAHLEESWMKAVCRGRSPERPSGGCLDPRWTPALLTPRPCPHVGVTTALVTRVDLKRSP